MNLNVRFHLSVPIIGPKKYDMSTECSAALIAPSHNTQIPAYVKLKDESCMEGIRFWNYRTSDKARALCHGGHFISYLRLYVLEVAETKKYAARQYSSQTRRIDGSESCPPTRKDEQVEDE